MPTSSPQPAASKADIVEALAPLLRTMPSKGKVQDRMEGYFIALGGFMRTEIEAGVRKFLSGECAGVKSEFVPLPPQLAKIVREAAGVQEAVARAEQGKTEYSFRRPRSKIIARNITKDQVREGRSRNVYPAGCIWCPGPQGNAEYGDLYSPDPDWDFARPVNAPEPEPTEPRQYRQPPNYAVQQLLDVTEPQRDEPEMEIIPPPKIHDYSQEPVEATPSLLKNLDDHAKSDAIEARRNPTDD